MKPQKEEKEQTGVTVGGNLIDYPGDKHAAAPVATISLVTNLLNPQSTMDPFSTLSKLYKTSCPPPQKPKLVPFF
jgi:hypothetical protein